ncbi:MAG: hypothetical protein PVH29_12365 [Candidatus Zixiibacteriota bacterium]|jgi:hypothetical protein
MKHPILSKHVKVKIQGPYGPEAVGEFTEASHTREIDVKEYVAIGEEVPLNLEATKKFSGSLSQGKIDETMARIIWGQYQVQRGQDPQNAPRYILTITKTYFDGTKGTDTYGDVLFHKVSEQIRAGEIVDQTFDWVGEKWENEIK